MPTFELKFEEREFIEGPNDSDLFTGGIDVGDHPFAIEIHGSKSKVAAIKRYLMEAIREKEANDKLKKLLTKN